MDYLNERFADIQLLRYRLTGFEQLTLLQKKLIYYLSEATLFGRDITFDQFGRYNLRIRKLLEAVWSSTHLPHDSENFRALDTYLKRVWFSSGIYHHYGCEKFEPGFSKQYLREALQQVEPHLLPLNEGETLDELCDELFPIIFDMNILPKRVNKTDGEDLILTSACNFYQDVTQEEAEQYYNDIKQADAGNQEPVSYGLNSTLVRHNDTLQEEVWKIGGRYGKVHKKRDNSSH